jgi:hypothetical protein
MIRNGFLAMVLGSLGLFLLVTVFSTARVHVITGGEESLEQEIL